ncbi:TetR/AcrR family transcriptional regulator [Nocardia bovistercoris]|uniref:TetR/AcrR family transcriptional regulator n=1 Tax=Nocardia bovistercoris TaxID=2785916 RepID=A0A931IH27_9NOCA|nr:TetR/AcrR family transcriptional regulator [Nocardia bovistercoris]MBH0780448.1 TetR/AcrR family transcriptional regulator [Nocardia bovistercoris]
MTSPPRTRMTATERSAEVLAAAVTAFAETGYEGTKTDEIARRSGVSQPYVIRLFGTKQQLFVAAVHAVCDRIEELFRLAGAGITPDTDIDEALRLLAGAYQAFLVERELPLVLMHGFAACGDPAVGDPVRDRFGRIYHTICELSGAPRTRARRFVANGMLLTVMSAMQVVGPDAIPVPWAQEIIDDMNESDCD